MRRSNFCLVVCMIGLALPAWVQAQDGVNPSGTTDTFGNSPPPETNPAAPTSPSSPGVPGTAGDGTASQSCTTTTGITYRQGEPGYDRCLQEMETQPEDEMGGQTGAPMDPSSSTDSLGS